MTKYVAGFLFSVDHSHVALVKKNKPAWQKGKLNAIGGKVEEGETCLEAMRREFNEETGQEVDRWESFAKLQGGESGLRWEVEFFKAEGSYDIRTVEEEEIGWYKTAAIPDLPVINNLRWLVPLAMADEEAFVTAEY